MTTKEKYKLIKQDVEKDLKGNTSIEHCKVTLVSTIRFISNTKGLYKHRALGLFLKMYDYMELKDKTELEKVLRREGF